MMWPLGGSGAGRDSPVNSASRLRPRAAVWLTWLPAQAPLPVTTQALLGLAQPRGNLGFPDDPSARRRGIAPKNIATFNTHTEAPEPMAGALRTGYDASFPALWVEAMKKPFRAGGKPARARSSKASKLKLSSVPKAAHRSAATQQTASWLENLVLGNPEAFAENRHHCCHPA